jgi:hypothetical protein
MIVVDPVLRCISRELEHAEWFRPKKTRLLPIAFAGGAIAMRRASEMYMKRYLAFQKSECVEVSMTRKDWTEVHRCTDNSDINGLTLIGTYEVNHSMKCRFVRLQQTGKIHYNTDHLLMCDFKIFGILREP